MRSHRGQRRCQIVLFAAVPALLSLALVGCTPSDDEALLASGEIGQTEPSPTAIAEAEDAAPADDGEPIVIDGFPAPGLVGCAVLVDRSVTSTEFDTQWRLEFVCRDRAPHDANVARLTSEGYAHPLHQSNGDERYVSEKDHFITMGSTDGALDVDLTLTGSPGELDYIVLVTLAND